MNIPLSKPYINENALQLIAESLSSEKLSGNGIFGKKAEQLLQTIIGSFFVMLSTSCSHALEMSIEALEPSHRQRKEIILPSFTFTSTANAIIRNGYTPVFADVDPLTMNISPESISRLVSSKTLAIIAVHYAGVSVDFTSLFQSNLTTIPIIEDAAQALGATYNGIPLGSLGITGCISFHDTKNIGCGEGGAIITNDEEISKRVEIIREKGTNRSQFLRGEVDKYTWVRSGSSYILAEPLAAFLLANLKGISKVIDARKTRYNHYIEQLQQLENTGVLQLPMIPFFAQSNYHLFHIFLPTTDIRDSLMKFLRDRGIGATFHYVPLHSSPMGLSLGWKQNDCPITENCSSRLLRLPLYHSLEEKEQDFIIECIYDWSKIMKTDSNNTKIYV